MRTDEQRLALESGGRLIEGSAAYWSAALRKSVLSIYRRNLPHWRVEFAFYFVTWRLSSDQPSLRPSERTLVRDALLFAEGKSFDLWAYVVMDDHVHALLRARIELQRVIHSWKSFTAHRLLALSDPPRGSPLWQAEYYDHIVRDDSELQRTIRYIVSNPQRRWPGTVNYEWVGERGLDGIR